MKKSIYFVLILAAVIISSSFASSEKIKFSEFAAESCDSIKQQLKRVTEEKNRAMILAEEQRKIAEASKVQAEKQAMLAKQQQELAMQNEAKAVKAHALAKQQQQEALRNAEVAKKQLEEARLEIKKLKEKTKN